MSTEKVNITVDGEILAVEKGVNLLQALLEHSQDLPYFCWHPKLGSIGACRQCAVVQYMNADDDRGRIVMSCMTPVAEGSIFSVQVDKAEGFRQSVIENLMLNHPHDCPVCEEGGECHLQDMTVMTGHRDRQYRYTKTTFRNQYLGPLINHEMNRCITCYRCVRYYQDYAGGSDLSAFGSRDRVFFGRSEEGVLQNEFAGNLVEVCPTGVFTDKTLSEHYSRKWDMQSGPAICHSCSLGCNITVSERYGELRRVTNRYHGEINGYFICDRGRFGAQYVNSEARISKCGIRNEQGQYDAVSGEKALNHIAEMLGQNKHVIAVGSARASLEANFALQSLVGASNFYSGLTTVEHEIAGLLKQLLNSNINSPSLNEVEDYDIAVVLGEDTTNHAPRLALSLRQLTRNKAKQLAESAGLPLWQDAAVRKLAQNERSPVYLVTPYKDRLDDVGIPVRLSPTAIADLGYSIAHEINDRFPTGNASGESVQAIVSALNNAKKPLIVTGSSLASVEIVKAALNVASALAKKNPNTGMLICTDDANELGLVSLCEHNLPSAAADVAVVLENDLLSTVDKDELDEWFTPATELIVLDSLDNETCSRSSVVLPAATFAEAEATIINNEGRAQRSFATFKPDSDIAPSWHWLLRMCHARGVLEEISHIDGLLESIASAYSDLAQVVDAAPGANYRDHGLKVSRMSQRYSGRTAMLANVSVHEPMQPKDEESALTYSMEGSNLSVPASIKAYSWAPGWNSNQSVNKFQDEIGGHLKGGDPGVLLFSSTNSLPIFHPVTGPTGRQMVPHWEIFGSEELSVRGPAVAELTPRPYALMNNEMASSLLVNGGDGIKSSSFDAVTLEVMVDDEIPDDCVVCPVLATTKNYLCEQGAAALIKDESWVKPVLIASDRRF